jgi:hypothetical protein
VAAFFCGPDHNDERTKRLSEFVGHCHRGGGAELRPVKQSDFTAFSKSVNHVTTSGVGGAALEGQAVQPDGAVIDSFTIALSQRN